MMIIFHSVFLLKNTPIAKLARLPRLSRVVVSYSNVPDVYVWHSSQGHYTIRPVNLYVPSPCAEVAM